MPNFPATTGALRRFLCPKFVFGRGSALDPNGGAHDVPPDPLVGWGGEYPLRIPVPGVPNFIFRKLPSWQP